MDDALEANDSEEPRAETGQPRQEQDGERQQGLPPGRLRQAAGQTSASCTGAAASFRDRRAAAAAVPRVRRSGVHWGFVFVVGNRVMLRHIPRSTAPSWQASETSYLVSNSKENPPFFLFSATLHFRNYLHHLPYTPRIPLNTHCDPKLLTLTSHGPQNQSKNPRESHCSTVLLHTGSATLSSSSSSFLWWSWKKGRERRVEQEEISACHSETGTAKGYTMSGDIQSHDRPRLTDNLRSQWRKSNLTTEESHWEKSEKPQSHQNFLPYQYQKQGERKLRANIIVKS